MAEVDVTQSVPQNLRNQVDEFSLRLYHLANVAKLAAFACEARRTLEGVADAVHFREEMREKLFEAIPCANNWREMEDVSGAVLQELARGLEAMQDSMSSAAAGSPGSTREAA